MSAINWAFRLCAAGSLVLIAVSLHLWGAAEIRRDIREVFILTLIGGVWLMVATKLFSWLGLSFRDDAVERKNLAALVAVCGGVGAVGLIYAGGSIGEGPSYLNNFFSAGMGTVGLLVLWGLLETGGELSVSIAEERDLASGIRLCGFLVAVGLVFGRAVAGDWHSCSATLLDFIVDGWPGLAICALAVSAEPFLRPSKRRPFPSWKTTGLIPAVLYLALAAAWMGHLGFWERATK